MSSSLHPVVRRGSAVADIATLVLVISNALLLLIGCESGDPVDAVRELHQAGRIAESVEPLRQLIAERPDDAEVHYLYGVSLLQTRQPSLAIWSFRKAMLDPEWLVPAALKLAAGALLTGNHDAALDVLTQALDAEPDNLDALLLRGRARVDSRLDYPGALRDADRALELDPDTSEAHVVRAVALLGLNRLEEAEVSLAVLEESHFDSDRIVGSERFCVAKALFAREMERLETAAEFYNGCLDEYPTRYLVIQEAIEFFDEIGDFARSQEILRSALEREPTAFPYRIALALRLRAKGEVAGAEQLLRKGTEGDQATIVVPVWMALADHFLNLEDYGAAADALGEAAIVAGEPTPELAFAVADALVMAGRYDEAMAAADRLALPAQREMVYGRIHLLQGRPAEALERFAAGLALWPDNSVVRYYAARAAEQVGDFDRAIAEYRYTLRSESDATDARLRLTRLYEAQGEHALALVVAAHRRAKQGNSEVDFETQLAALRASARVGRLGQWRQHFSQYIGLAGPWALVVVAVAEGVRDRLGPTAAADVIRNAERLDLTDPRNAVALRALVLDLMASGDTEAAVQYVSQALAAAPRAAIFNAIHALLLDRQAAPRNELEAAYRRTVELDSESLEALIGLGRLAGDARSALVFFSRAAESHPEDAAAQIGMSEALVALGRPAEAAEPLERALSETPYHAEVARRLAELMLRNDTLGDEDRALDLAQRAIRFGDGSPESFELLQRVHERRGEVELAAKAAARATAASARAQK